MMANALILSLALGAGAASERAMRLLDDWIATVDRHATGERDEALARIGEWNAKDLELVRAYLEALAGVPLDTPERSDRRRQIGGTELAAIRALALEVQAHGSFDQFRKRAAMLHTDAALFEAPPTAVPADVAPWQQRPNVPAPEIDFRSSDGRIEYFLTVNPHWSLAMDMLDALPASPRRDPMIARWYRAVGAQLVARHSFGDAFRHFARALKIVPDDPGVLFGDACLQEFFGSAGEQSLRRAAKLPVGYTMLGAMSPRAHFRRAELSLKRALAAQPGFLDARLRLGHVLVEQGQHEAALPHLRQVAAESKDPVLRYYAHVFAGSATLALDRIADARASFELALELYPSAQAARLGLAAALRASGDRTAAIDAAMTTLTVHPDGRDVNDDPWWNYYEGDAANVDRLLEELWAAAGKAPAR